VLLFYNIIAGSLTNHMYVRQIYRYYRKYKYFFRKQTMADVCCVNAYLVFCAKIFLFPLQLINFSDVHVIRQGICNIKFLLLWLTL